MLDKFDYEEPRCTLCDGEAFYNPKQNAPLGRIPVARIIEKLDALFDKNDVKEAGKLLLYWKEEAVALRDTLGELAMESELVGYYRKQNNREAGLVSVSCALRLCEALSRSDTVSGATIFINCATAYKAFGMPDEAMPLYRRAEEIYRRLLDAKDVRFGGLYNNMALALVDLGDYAAAERAYYLALDVMGSVTGGEAESAITYINLAHMYEHAGTPEKIEDCMKRAYALLKSEYLQHNGYYAFVLEKCAPSFGYFGNEAAYAEFKALSEAIYEGP